MQYKSVDWFLCDGNIEIKWVKLHDVSKVKNLGNAQ